MGDIRDVNAQMLSAMRDLQSALDELPRQAQAYAAAEREFKRSWAKAILQSEGKNAEERAARAEIVRFATGDLSDLRYNMTLADGLRSSSRLAVQSYMSLINALQSQSAGIRQEMRFAQTGPDYDSY